MQRIVIIDREPRALAESQLTEALQDTRIIYSPPQEKLRKVLEEHPRCLIIDSKCVAEKGCTSSIISQVPIHSEMVIEWSSTNFFNLSPRTSFESILPILNKSLRFPLLGMLLSQPTITRLLDLCDEIGEPLSFDSALLGSYVIALSNETPSHSLVMPTIAPTEAPPLTSANKSFILKALLHLRNIEEIFPSLDWETGEVKTAAYAYQRLASCFLDYEDAGAAMECLTLSEQFEESGRSFALRGVIASSKGDTLAAVANMVSSLQQYEEDTHKQESKLAKEVEIAVTECLKGGLKALNKQDNKTAFTKFAQAVSKYDSFFNQQGLQKLIVDPESE